mmetsp:Transcript_19267/g.49025  ORF Transcript_19267/g.49025 Transcript_19267/m.49025 type:complete len:360 (+) Transcript_19267:13-1092(+)
MVFAVFRLGAVRRLATAAAAAAALPRRVLTAPHALVTVLGAGGDVTITTNMESEVATIRATDALGNALDAEAAVRVEHTGNGTDFEVHGVEVGTSLAISVPASFSVVACREGRTANLRMDGWIEGGVRLTTEQGDVGVQTVRGMLTTLATGAGNIAAEMIDGDAALSTGQGDITIGKLQGKVLNAASGGGNVSAKALYCEDAHIATRNGRVQLNFLHTLRASVAVSNGEVNIDALDGSVSVRAAEGGRIRVQLSDGAREIELHADGDVEVLIPDDLGFEASASAPHVRWDPALQPLISEDMTHNGVQSVSVRRERAEGASAVQAGSSPPGRTSVRAVSTAGTVHFRAHSWLDRFKARMA